MKKLFFFLSVFLLSSLLFSLEVDRNELQSTENQTIEFINYSGPHKVIESIDAIKGIGTSLGNAVSPSPTEPITTQTNAKYYVVHAIDNSTNSKLDADIMFINSDATVDHIVNLRRIISAYLTSAYGYSQSDADTLAVFITVYNAVNRGKISSYQDKYKDAVINNLTSDNCGLSINYSDWPGKSQIVIPLYDVSKGGLSTVDTSVISDSKVVESMQTDDGKNIDSRKEMVDIKEREATEASQNAQDSQKKAVEEQTKLENQKKTTDNAKQDLQNSKKEADTKQQEAQKSQEIADKNPNDKVAAKEAEKKQEEAKQAQEVVQEKEAVVQTEQEKLDEQQQKTDAAKEQAKTEQERADVKQNEAQTERKEIAKDQQIVQKEEIAQAKMSTEYGIILSDESKMLSKLVKFNTATGEIIKTSPVSVIRNRSIYKTTYGYLAIAGENKGNSTVKLVLLDADTMEIIKESNETISENSVLINDSNNYYCVIQSDKNWTIAKYDETLTLKLKSNINVKSSTPITITDSGIVVTDSNGKLAVLSKQDLSNIAK